MPAPHLLFAQVDIIPQIGRFGGASGGVEAGKLGKSPAARDTEARWAVGCQYSEWSFGHLCQFGTQRRIAFLIATKKE
jgi:hypothetical protein